MSDFLDQYAVQFRAAAESQASRRRRVPVVPVAAAALAAAAIGLAVLGGDSGPRPDEVEQKPAPASTPAGFAGQRALLGVLRTRTKDDDDPQVRRTMRDFRDERPRTARLLGFAPSGSAYVLVATRRYRDVDARTVPPTGARQDVRWRRDGLCLMRRGTQGGAGLCTDTAGLRAGRLHGAMAGEVYGVVPDGVTHVRPPRGHAPVAVRRNFYAYPARGNPGPPPVWLDARGAEVPRRLSYLDRPGGGSLADFRGEVTVVVLWASWCKPCGPQLETLQALHDRGVPVVGVATGDTTEQARGALEEHGVHFPVLEDPEAVTAQRRDVKAFPATLILDAEGRVTARLEGLATAEEIESAVSRAG